LNLAEALDPEVLRNKLRNIISKDPVCADLFPLTGNLDRAKFSRGRLLCKVAFDNNLDLEQAQNAAVGLELVHLATLVHDDVIDDSDLRRDKASLRSVKGDRAAILFGDFLFSAAIKQIQTTQNQNCATTFTERVYDTCRGESIQDLMLTWEDSKPNLSLLIEAARGKTGALFSFCTEAPLWFGDYSDEQRSKARECGFLGGLAFQLADDLLDIAGSTEDLGKPAGNDLIKNTMTTPLFFVMEEQNLNWNQLRDQYSSNTQALREDFFNGKAHQKLLNLIEDTKNKLNTLGQELEHSAVTIQGSLDLFWSRYVESRMLSLRDNRS
jgi:geranylgeranyl pyrophosphate synthase